MVKFAPAESKILKVILFFNILPLIEALPLVSPVVTTVPDLLGKVIVLVPVGSIAVNMVWLLSSIVPSKDSIPPSVISMLVLETVPVIGPVKAAALTVPPTSNVVVGFVFVLPIPTLEVAPSMVITVVTAPPSLIVKLISALLVLLIMETLPFVSTAILRSSSAPICNPSSFLILTFPTILPPVF